MNDTLFFGNNITNPSEQLQPLTVSDLYERLKQPAPNVQRLVENLRVIKNTDEKQYGITKRQLPFVVCAKFNPAIRRSENFVNTSYFIIDLDHISQADLDLTQLRPRLQADPRVALAFVSPSNDGLKLLFCLKERCCDPAIYSLFYKMFVQHFATEYKLDQVIDTRTKDVTRACFLSYDPEAYLNPNPELIDINAFVNPDDYNLLDEKRRMDKQEQVEAAQNKSEEPKPEPDKDTILKIKEILALKRPQPTKPPITIPEPLNLIADTLQEQLNDYSMTVDSVTDISYGKKFKCHIGLRQAECNVYYGKRGFSVQISPRTGTDPELNQLLQQLLQTLISDIVYASQETSY